MGVGGWMGECVDGLIAGLVDGLMDGFGRVDGCGWMGLGGWMG